MILIYCTVLRGFQGQVGYRDLGVSGFPQGPEGFRKKIVDFYWRTGRFLLAKIMKQKSLINWVMILEQKKIMYLQYSKNWHAVE